MNTPSSKSGNVLYTIVCSTLGHDYMITRKVTNHINEYKCANCGREVTDTFTGKIEMLTQAAKNANSNLAAFFLKKSKRLTA